MSTNFVCSVNFNSKHTVASNFSRGVSVKFMGITLHGFMLGAKCIFYVFRIKSAMNSHHK